MKSKKERKKERKEKKKFRKNPMKEKKVIHRFVCDAMLKMAKPKMGVKLSDSNHAYLLDLYCFVFLTQ